MDPFSITNHIDYAEHMKGFISRTECKAQITDLQQKLERERLVRQELEAQIRTLTKSLKGLISHYNASVTEEPVSTPPVAVQNTFKGAIEDHPEYPALMARMEKRAREMCSKVEAETKRTWQADIRKHPDYVYLQKYYEEKIKSLQQAMR